MRHTLELDLFKGEESILVAVSDNKKMFMNVQPIDKIINFEIVHFEDTEIFEDLTKAIEYYNKI